MKPKRLATIALAAAATFGASAHAQEIPHIDAEEAAAAAAETPEPSKWETSAGVGVTLTEGNSETSLFTINAQALRKTSQSEFSLGADAGYGENDGEQNVGYVKGFAQYNYLWTERWFAFIRAEALHDAVSDLKYRVPLTAGIGYYIIKNDRTTLSVEAGPGYVWEKVGHDSRGYATIRFSEKFTHKFSDRARIWQSVDYQPNVGDLGEYFLSAEVGVAADVTQHIELRVVLQDWYVSEPAPGRDGNDLKLIAGVNYKFP